MKKWMNDIRKKVMGSPELDDEGKEIVEDILQKDVNVSISKEFQNFLSAVREVWGSDQEDEVKRAITVTLFNRLSEAAYVTYFPQIVSIIQKSKEKCARYKNTKEQVDNIIGWLPRFEENLELLTLYIQERRKKYKLEV